MTDKINEIRERHLRDEPWRHIPSMICPQAHDDRALLLAEIERLRAELDRTHEQLDAAVTLLAEWCHAVDVCGASWDYWDNHYKQARWGKGVLRSLIDAEMAKLEPLEGEP